MDEQQAMQKLLSLLGLARRAGKLALGADAVTEAVQSGGARLVVFSSDLSSRTSGAVARAAHRVLAVSLPASMEEIGRAVGKRTGVTAVLDDGFARKMLELGREAGAAVTMIGRDLP